MTKLMKHVFTITAFNELVVILLVEFLANAAGKAGEHVVEIYLRRFDHVYC